MKTMRKSIGFARLFVNIFLFLHEYKAKAPKNRILSIVRLQKKEFTTSKKQKYSPLYQHMWLDDLQKGSPAAEPRGEAISLNNRVIVLVYNGINVCAKLDKL